MNGFFSTIAGIGLVLCIMGLFGAPTLPLGAVMLFGGFFVGWFFSPERAEHQYRQSQTDDLADKFMNGK